MPNSNSVKQLRQFLRHQAAKGFVRIGFDTIQPGAFPHLISAQEESELLQEDVMLESERILGNNGDINPAAVELLIQCNALDSEAT